MSETNGDSVQETTTLEPSPGYVIVQFSTKRKTKSGLLYERTYNQDIRVASTFSARVLAVGIEKQELGSIISPPCESEATVLFPNGCGYDITDYMKLDRGVVLDDAERVIVLKFEDVLCTVFDE